MIELRSKWGELIKGVGIEILEAIDQGRNSVPCINWK